MSTCGSIELIVNVALNVSVKATVAITMLIDNHNNTSSNCLINFINHNTNLECTVCNWIPNIFKHLLNHYNH